MEEDRAVAAAREAEGDALPRLALFARVLVVGLAAGRGLVYRSSPRGAEGQRAPCRRAARDPGPTQINALRVLVSERIDVEHG